MNTARAANVSWTGESAKAAQNEYSSRCGKQPHHHTHKTWSNLQAGAGAGCLEQGLAEVSEEDGARAVHEEPMCKRVKGAEDVCNVRGLCRCHECKRWFANRRQQLVQVLLGVSIGARPKHLVGSVCV